MRIARVLFLFPCVVCAACVAHALFLAGGGQRTAGHEAGHERSDDGDMLHR